MCILKQSNNMNTVILLLSPNFGPDISTASTRVLLFNSCFSAFADTLYPCLECHSSCTQTPPFRGLVRFCILHEAFLMQHIISPSLSSYSTSVSCCSLDTSIKAAGCLCHVVPSLCFVHQLDSKSFIDKDFPSPIELALHSIDACLMVVTTLDENFHCHDKQYGEENHECDLATCV